MRDRESVRGRWKTSSPVRHRTGYSPRTSVRWEAATRCRSERRASCDPGLSTGGSGRCLEHWKGLKARDQKQDVCRPLTDGAATRKRRAAGKRKKKEGRESEADRLDCPAPLRRSDKSGRPSEAIAAGRKPSEAPGKTKNREIGKIKKGRKA